MTENHPVASLERLKELGMDIRIYPSCAEFIQRSIPNRGKVTEQKGCKFWHECEWANNTKWMKQRDEKDVHPRPRFIKTRFVKPNPLGPGDRVIDNYCGCWQWHQDLKRRHKLNRELAAVIGGEGDDVTLKTSKKIIQADNTIVFESDYKTVKVPTFPDPIDSSDLKEDVFAAKARSEINRSTDEVEDARRLGIRPPGELGDGTSFVEMGEEDVKAATGR